jgi:hypothetical protein
MTSLLGIVTRGMLGGGSGSVTYLAGGTEIDLRMEAQSIDIQTGDKLDIQPGEASIDLAQTGKELDLNYDGLTVDL